CEPRAVDTEDRVRHHEKSFRALLDHRGEGAVELAWCAHLQKLKRHSQRSSGGLYTVYRERVARGGRVRQDREALPLGDDLLEELQLLAEQVRADAERHPCNVPARVREARDESVGHRIASAPYDDRDCPCRPLGCQGRRRWSRNDDLHLEPDQL